MSKTLSIHFGLEDKPRTIYTDQLAGIAVRIMEKQKLTAYDLHLIQEVPMACHASKLVNKED